MAVMMNKQATTDGDRTTYPDEDPLEFAVPLAAGNVCDGVTIWTDVSVTTPPSGLVLGIN